MLRTGCQTLRSPAGCPHISKFHSILSLRGGSNGVEPGEAPIDDAEFSLGEVDPASSTSKSKYHGAAEQASKVQSCDDSEAHFPDYHDDKEEARVIDCKFSHIGDKNGVIYYLGKSTTLTSCFDERTG